MYGNVSSVRPLSIKFALLTAAVGAGFAAPAQAALISAAPAWFTPMTFSSTTLSGLVLDLDGNDTIDFTIHSMSPNDGGPVIVGTTARNQVDTFFGSIVGYADPSHFMSASSIKGRQTASLTQGNISIAYPYVELAFAGIDDVLTRGYLQGYSTVTGDDRSFTLVDFGLAPEAEVPEPGSLALLAAGAAGIVALRRRRKERAL